MRLTRSIFVTTILMLMTASAHAQDCASASGPTCDGTCPEGLVCDAAGGGAPGCGCVEGDVLDVTKIGIKFNFAKVDKDGIKLDAIIPVLDGFSVEGKVVVVDVGGVVRGFMLDAKGKGELDDDKIALKVKAKGGIVAAQDAKLSVKVKGTLAMEFVDEGVTDTTVKDAPVSVPVEVSIDSSLYRKVMHLTYKATQGKSGKAYLPK